MTLQTTGPISTYDIQIELGLSGTASNQSMDGQAAAHLPTALTQPHLMSEWYGYTHTTLTAPTKVNLTEGPIAFTGIWFDASNSGHDGYKLEYRINTGNWTAWTTIANPATTTYTAKIVGCSSGDVMGFRVYAYDGAVDGPYGTDPAGPTSNGNGCI